MKDQAGQKTISEKFIDQLYNIRADIIDENGNKMEIPESGFLGLLATGYKGLALLRKRREQTHLYAKFTKGKKLIRRKPAAPKAKKRRK